MPKTITGQELELDDGPARGAELFLVDGNNLAYRAFFALPEELATSDGHPTNALLGFANMLFKLLADYKPKGVAVERDGPTRSLDIPLAFDLGAEIVDSRQQRLDQRCAVWRSASRAAAPSRCSSPKGRISTAAMTRGR